MPQVRWPQCRRPRQFTPRRRHPRPLGTFPRLGQPGQRCFPTPHLRPLQVPQARAPGCRAGSNPTGVDRAFGLPRRRATSSASPPRPARPSWFRPFRHRRACARSSRSAGPKLRPAQIAPMICSSARLRHPKRSFSLRGRRHCRRAPVRRFAGRMVYSNGCRMSCRSRCSST